MLKALLTIGGLQLATMVVMLVRTKILALLLGPEGVGMMGVVDKLLAVVVQSLSLSLPFAALRYLPELWNADRGACYRTHRSIVVTLASLSVLAAIGGVSLSMLAPGTWGARLAAHPTLLAAAFLCVPVLALIPYVQNAYAGILRHRSSMLFALAHAGVQTAAGLLGAVLAGLTGLYLAYAAAASVLAFPALSRLTRTMRPDPAPGWRSWREAFPSARILRFSAAMMSLTVVAPAAALVAHYQVLDRLGAQAAGWMQSAIGISLAVRAVLGAAHAAFLTPHLNKGGSWQQRMDWAARFQHLWCLIAGALVPPLLIGADLAVVILYAPSFLPATQYVHLFVFVEVLTLLAGTYQGIVVAAERLRFHVAQNLSAQFIYMTVAWLAIPRFGIAGAAFGAIAAQAFLFVCTTAYLHTRMGLHPPWRTTALTLGLLAALSTIGWLGSEGLVLGPGRLLPAVAVYGLTLIALTRFLGAHERERIRAIWQRVTRSA